MTNVTLVRASIEFSEVDLIAEQTGVRLGIKGEMCNGSSLIGDVMMKFQASFDDGSNVDIGIYTATAGGFGNGAPENGDYIVRNYQDRSPTGWYNEGMNRDGVGFSYDLEPSFNTGRSLLRIHPDGNKEGTLGCIGLTGNRNQLNSFREKLNNYLKYRYSLPASIDINKNPNNNGKRGVKEPNVNE
jgi:hypothetical protein